MQFTSALVGGMRPLLFLSGCHQWSIMLNIMPTALLALLALASPVPRPNETDTEALAANDSARSAPETIPGTLDIPDALGLPPILGDHPKVKDRA
ncbi:hypothetical protein PG996_008590 [Apiospora saccharicola]|uniref:Uncharacterized protein n=1 Tax=Apiospora saccharicola TaxID=335842 RepID=A0ABR1UYC8_9PEZI